MNLSWKSLTVPADNTTKDIQVVQLWYVRWRSRYGDFSNDTRPEVEAFTSEEEAKAFALSLRNAFSLIKHTAGTNVTVTKEK